MTPHQEERPLAGLRECDQPSDGLGLLLCTIGGLLGTVPWQSQFSVAILNADDP